MPNVKLTVAFEGKTFKIKMGSQTTVRELQIKLRQYLKMKDCDAIFLFFNYKTGFLVREKLFQQTKKLYEIQAETNCAHWT